MNFIKFSSIGIFGLFSVIYTSLFLSSISYIEFWVCLVTLAYSVIFFLFYFLTSRNQIFKFYKEINFSRVELFIIGTLLSFVLGAVIEAIFGFRDPYILTLGHQGDFFQMIYLAYINNFTDVTNGGYLPGMVILSKLTSYLFIFSDNMIRNEWNIILYVFISLTILTVSTIPFLKDVTFFKKIIVFSLLLISLPFHLNMERGNWVLLSLLLLSLILLSSSRYRNIFIATFASLKIFNLPFAALFALSKNVSIKMLLITSVLLYTAFALIIIILNIQVDYSLLLHMVTSHVESMFFPDGHIATAHSGLYATLAFYDLSNVSLSLNRAMIVSYFFLAMKSLLILFFSMLIYFRFMRNNDKDDREFIVLSFIGIFFTLKLFHPANTDMNLILIIPVFCILLADVSKKSYLVPSALMSIIFFDLTFYSLLEVQHIDMFKRESMHYFTLKTFIYPIIYSGLIISSLYEIIKKMKNNNSM